MRPLIEERKHELMLSFTSTGLRIEADPTRLEQILVNLLTNAAKYTPPGAASSSPPGTEGDEVVFRVRDNGVGIAAGVAPADVRALRPGATARSPARRGAWASG